MKFCLFGLLLSISHAAAFISTSTTNSRSLEVTELYGGAQGYASTLPGKKEKVARVKELLDTSQMVFTIPASAMSVQQAQKLRESLPEGTTASVVKNKLMLRALEGTEFSEAVTSEGSTMLKGANMWFFIDEDISGTIKAYNGFLKDEGLKESHQILSGVLESVLYDSEGVEAIGKLPTKKELYARLAGALKAVPTKVARVIKAPTTKLARAIKLATMPDEE
eukprot:CAMPEP_0194145980 /NCGR_PEP_ID=MMETSP0152-20130528/19063_1 /TAXON_ID=1049557 /ORGANISM="Thalassiothrix antarctica, Strain L6-D1" /LENGTH=221 /DNA_ID=CAMNT_0038846369 /DNA_START=88 /DNA_END=753 /DNA_ORIENTATION=+